MIGVRIGSAIGYPIGCGGFLPYPYPYMGPDAFHLTVIYGRTALIAVLWLL